MEDKIILISSILLKQKIEENMEDDAKYLVDLEEEKLIDETMGKIISVFLARAYAGLTEKLLGEK